MTQTETIVITPIRWEKNVNVLVSAPRFIFQFIHFEKPQYNRNQNDEIQEKKHSEWVMAIICFISCGMQYADNNDI